MSGNIVSYSSEELKAMRARGESQTDWERVLRNAREGIEPDLSDPDDAGPTEEEFAAALAQVRRGRPRAEVTKQAIHIRLSAEVVEAFRRTGRGWQGRIDQALKEWLVSHPL